MIKILKNSISNLKNVSRSFGSQSTGTFEKLVNHKSNLELKLKDSNNEEKSLKFNPHWLRFNCILCKDQSSGQRTIRSESIPIDLSIKDVKIFENNVIIKWNDESNQQDSQLPLSFLMNHHPSETPHEARFKPCREIGFLDYSKFYDSNNERNYSEIIKWYQQMADYGVAVLRNCGTKENTVRGIAELIAPVQRTLYGEEFDVRVEKNITNIALLDGPLPLHMDLPYYETPPGLQFLHCISFDKEIVGGESLLLDSYATLEEFRVKYPEYFYNLTKIPASWQYLIVGAQKQEVMMMSQPHIRLNHLDQIIGFRWSQDQEGPLKNLSEEKNQIVLRKLFNIGEIHK